MYMETEICNRLQEHIECFVIGLDKVTPTTYPIHSEKCSQLGLSPHGM